MYMQVLLSYLASLAKKKRVMNTMVVLGHLVLPAKQMVVYTLVVLGHLLFLAKQRVIYVLVLPGHLLSLSKRAGHEHTGSAGSLTSSSHARA